MIYGKEKAGKPFSFSFRTGLARDEAWKVHMRHPGRRSNPRTIFVRTTLSKQQPVWLEPGHEEMSKRLYHRSHRNHYLT